MSAEVREDIALRNRPVALGLLLTPLGGVVGVATSLGFQGGATGLNAIVMLAIGAFIGSVFAAPVTLLVFPVMHRWRPAPIAYPVVGIFAGYLYGTLNPYLAPAAMVGGLVTGSVFAFFNRARRVSHDATDSRAHDS